MKIHIHQLKTCPINSEIYRDSDVEDLVNSIGEVGLLNSQGDVKQAVNVDGLFVGSSTIKFIFTALKVKSPPSTPSSPVSNPTNSSQSVTLQVKSPHS